MPGDEEFALSIYQALRAQGGGAAEEISAASGLDAEQSERGWRRLRALGLVQDHGGSVEPVEPDTALIRTMDAFHANAAERVRTAATLQNATQTLMTVYRPAVAREASQVEVEFLADRRRKDRALQELNGTTRKFADSLHPGPMPPAQVLEDSLGRDAEMIARGVRVRAIYPQSLLQSTRSARYLSDLSELGAEVRLVDHAPFDLLIMDHMVACLPANPDDPPRSMILIRGAALIRTYVAMYEDYWLRSTPYEHGLSGQGDGESDLTPQERVVIRLMSDGLSDDQIARKMGVHRRTVQRAVAKLMERLQASSRFEAGLKLAQDREYARALRPPMTRPSAPVR